jgi:prepilin-type N-terminal cleavage/methylation domain-containing protein/prepilin-type processing-associated H-X9-DG protein
MKNLYRVDRTTGWTLIEILVVVSIIAVLASILLPALEKSRSMALRAKCMSNKRQLGIASLMYPNDNGDRLVRNSMFFGVSDVGKSLPFYPFDQTWVPGLMSWDLLGANTNLDFLTKDEYSLISSYIARNPQLYKCPADTYLSDIQKAAGWRMRVRSVSMNHFVGEGMLGDVTKQSRSMFQVFTKSANIVGISPSKLWVIMDENPDAISLALFRQPAVIVDPKIASWTAIPGALHRGYGTISFADGHAEVHRWRTPDLLVPVRCSPWPVNVCSITNSPDWAWFRESTAAVTPL